MSQKEKLLLFLSIAISIALWGMFYGWKFGLILVTSLLIHEFGHYRQMGREGISKRSMFMLPPLGAIAFSKEPWPTRLAETKIALAGPLWGTIPVLVLLFWWYFVQPLPFFAASAAIIAFANLFNLALPVAVLDGGRVIKSVLFSWRPVLGLVFYSISIGMLLLLLISNLFFLPIVLLLFLALNDERRSYLYARSELTKVRQLMTVAGEIWQRFTTEADSRGVLPWLQHELILNCVSDLVYLQEQEKNLQLIAEPLSMTGRQIIASLVMFIALIIFYLWIIGSVTVALGTKGNPASLLQLFNSI